LHTLPKAIGSGLVAGRNVVGTGCQAKPRTLPKGTTSLGHAA